MLAVVTGASRGLGRFCAHELAAHGADLLLIARDQAALADVAREIIAKCPGRRVTTLSRDLGEAEAPRYVREAAEQLGPIDILINNAAVQGPIGPAWKVPWREFEAALRLDFLIPVALCRAVIPSMKARGRGWISNISGGGATSPRPMFTAYAAAKDRARSLLRDARDRDGGLRHPRQRRVAGRLCIGNYEGGERFC